MDLREQAARRVPGRHDPQQRVGERAAVKLRLVRHLRAPERSKQPSIAAGGAAKEARPAGLGQGLGIRIAVSVTCGSRQPERTYTVASTSCTVLRSLSSSERASAPCARKRPRANVRRLQASAVAHVGRAEGSVLMRRRRARQRQRQPVTLPTALPVAIHSSPKTAINF
eukprot:5364235-Prymnesium_polylepis.1